MIHQLKTKKEKVEFILKNFEYARENDNYLISLYWQIFDNVFHVGDIVKATPPEVIRRVRQKFNEQGMYLPKNPQVRKRRKINEKEMRLGINKIA
jgi:hypothetical protein